MKQEPPNTRNRSLALSLIALVAGMLMLSYASVPLYRLFCQVTGFGGTTARTAVLPTTIGTRDITVDFNTEVDAKLNWDFKPLQKQVTLKPGEQKLVFFSATNHETVPVSGSAVFNVVPFKAGPYFVKTECFCFKEQRLEPNQTATMPVSFFVDPEIENNPDMADVRNITLSYTFFKTKHPKK